jgi:hypothetical protein
MSNDNSYFLLLKTSLAPASAAKKSQHLQYDLHTSKKDRTFVPL